MGAIIYITGGLLIDDGWIRMEYEPLSLTYSQFLQFCFNNDLDKFYEGNRWTDWRNEVVKLSGDQAFSFRPFLWTEEGKDINTNSRKAISIEELYNFNVDMRKQLGLDK